MCRNSVLHSRSTSLFVVVVVVGEGASLVLFLFVCLFVCLFVVIYPEVNPVWLTGRYNSEINFFLLVSTFPQLISFRQHLQSVIHLFPLISQAEQNKLTIDKGDNKFLKI